VSVGELGSETDRPGNQAAITVLQLLGISPKILGFSIMLLFYNQFSVAEKH